MFRIQKSTNGKFVVFALSGRMNGAGLVELQKLLEFEAGNPDLILDLREVKLVDRDAINFFRGCETQGVNIMNCPAYIREWIAGEVAQSKITKQ